METKRLWAIVAAGGKGNRFGAQMPKQYVSVAGVTLLDQVIKTFVDSCIFSKIAVPIPQDDDEFHRLNSASYPIVYTTLGGKERSDSVFFALESLRDQGAKDSDWVFVHDAARPLITKNELWSLVEVIKVESCPGVVMGIPCVDTLKLAHLDSNSGKSDCVEKTIDRTGIWHAMTPQVFRLGDLLHALYLVRENLQLINDDSQAIEGLGIKPWLLRGRRSNFKLTYPEDLELIEKILKLQMGL